MSKQTLFSRRQILALFGGGTGAAIVGVDAQSTGEAADGNLLGGADNMPAPYQVGEKTYKGPLSVRSEVPQEDGVTYIQTDAGSANDQFSIYLYNGGWGKQGLNTPSLDTEELLLEEPPSTGGTGGEIQDALDNVGAGGAVRLPPGEWQITSPISLPDDTVLKGAGRKQTILKQADGADISGGIVQSQNVGAGVSTVYQGDIFDLTVDGNRANNSNSLGIQGNFWDHGIVNVEVRNCPSIGINIIDPDDEGAEAVNHYVSGCYVHHNGGSGIDMNGATDSIFVGNKVYSNDAYGLSAKVAWNQKITANHFYTNNFGSINMDRQKWCFIVSNRMNGSAGSSQQINFSSDIGVNCAFNLVGYNWMANASVGVKMASASSTEFCEQNWIGPNYYGLDTAIQSDANNKDNHYSGFLGTPTTYVANEGVRETIDGWGSNAGDPNTTGDWNGNGKEGDAVVDETNSVKYVYRGGAWV